ncbi:MULTISPECIES: type I restriction endonuclease [Vagococcus]|uniref:Prophage Lp2 protein 6 n=1 Tax=Vagococcus fluvialis bH819 TaxID=1255619 RepID=A0A1X6WN42_9ENTE|nr:MULTISPECIES: type I restriction endonuclease [Vagococcus]SLM85761.1 Prophage Lp2 protein 6 [Vagococcus fluvialis bH819]HCM90183.1 endonuclease [Vagococcus sp.]
MEKENQKEALKTLGKKVSALKEKITTEEATKTSLIMPFFSLLGYDVFNPLEFIPEFTADVGIKKGEKVDYAIVVDNTLTILIEAKAITEKLNKHDSQLFRYFGTTNAKFSILTNGQEYRFYTDLEQTNKMDNIPFLTFNISSLKESQIPEILKFSKNNFDINEIVSSASELKYINALKFYMDEQFETPSEDFVRFLSNNIYDGVKTKQIIDKFTPIVKKGLNQIITELVNEKLSSALNTSVEVKEVESKETEVKSSILDDSNIVTTPEELEAFTAVKVLLNEVIDIERLFYRDNRSYFNVLLDDNIRKWILRYYDSSSNKRIELNNPERTIIEVTSPLNILNYKNEVLEVIHQFI